MRVITKTTNAFCAPLISTPSTPNRSPVQCVTTSFHPTWYHPANRRRASPSIPLRISVRNTRTPKCAVDDNRNSATYKVADLLLSAGRFLQSPSGQVVLWGALVWLVLTGRIGIIFDSFLVLFAVLTIVPVAAMLVFRWWINRQLVQGTCPSCGASVTGLKGRAVNCAVCGNAVQTENTGNFSVKDPSSATIDIDAKEID